MGGLREIDVTDFFPDKDWHILAQNRDGWMDGWRQLCLEAWMRILIEHSDYQIGLLRMGRMAGSRALHTRTSGSNPDSARSTEIPNRAQGALRGLEAGGRH